MERRGGAGENEEYAVYGRAKGGEGMVNSAKEIRGVLWCRTAVVGKGRRRKRRRRMIMLLLSYHKHGGM